MDLVVLKGVWVEITELVRLYPNLYHMAADGSWPSIRQHGLLPTERLLELYGVEAEATDAILRSVRSESVTIQHPALGNAVVRDQMPMSLSKLEACLDGMTSVEWLELLNRQVFFWLQEGRLARMMGARPYRDGPHHVLVIDTSRLIELHQDSVSLSRINSGATLFVPPRRGIQTFQPIEEYQHPARKAPLAGCSDVAELAVIGGVPAIESVVLRVERRDHANGLLEVIWEEND